MKKIQGNITSPKGFKASGLCCGIKKSGKPDLSLIYSETPSVAAGVFTKNSIKAAPLIVTQKHLNDNTAQAIVINSGNANCFTGSFGLLYAKKTTEVIAKLLSIKKTAVLVASTGIIGKPLPYGKIHDAAPKLVKGLSKKGGQKAARAILTTDITTKKSCVTLSLNGKKAILGAIAKGSGMIEPNMATMLAFITTDICIHKRMLTVALKKVVEQTFNRITVDGCMSTNDMVLIMANGLAKNKMITKPDKNFDIFCESLHAVCLDLAKKIVLDGEGATKFIEITVKGAKTQSQATRACFAIANSNLVKTAAFGSNPNWGRVAAAVGSLGLNLTEEKLRIKFSLFKKKSIFILVDMNLGTKQDTVYTSDLSYEYIRINGKYN